MIRRNEEHEEKCSCPIYTGGIVGLLEIIALTGDLSIISNITPGPDRECNCPKCQQYFWEEDDKVDAGISFKKDKKPLFVLLPPHHRKVKKLIDLNKELKEQNTDLVLWKKIVEKHDNSAFEELSESGKMWLKKVATKTLDKVEKDSKKDGKKDAKKILNSIKTMPDFIELMTGKKTFKNRVLQEGIEKVCKNAIEDFSPKIQKKIDKIKADLPEEHHNATEPLKLEIPLEELEAIIRDHITAV